MWFLLLIHCRWRSWGCCLGQGSRQIFWIGFAICWCRLSGGYFVWISSWVCFHSTTWTKFSFYLLLTSFLKEVIKKTSFLKELSFSRIAASCWYLLIFQDVMLQSFLFILFPSVVWWMGHLNILRRILGLLKTLFYKASVMWCLFGHSKIRITWSWCK